MKLLATGAVAAIFGAMSAIGVAWFSYAGQNRELDIRMVELSLSILSGDKGSRKDEETNVVVDTFGEYELSRLFALRTLERYSGVDIPDGEMRSWAISGGISFGAIPTSSDWTASLSADPHAVTLDGDHLSLVSAKGSIQYDLSTAFDCVAPSDALNFVPSGKWRAVVQRWLDSSCPGARAAP